MNILIGFLIGVFPGIIIYVLGARDFKDWLWILPAETRKKLLSKVREVAGRFTGKEP